MNACRTKSSGSSSRRGSSVVARASGRVGLRVGGNALATQSAWPKLTLRIDAAEIADDLRQPLLPRMLLLDADANSSFVREWTPNVMPPLRHRAYALQWFTFALVALVVFVAVHWRKQENQ